MFNILVTDDEQIEGKECDIYAKMREEIGA